MSHNTRPCRNIGAVILLIAAVACLIGGCGPRATPTRTAQEIDLAEFFAGYQGCFALLDVEQNQYTRYNPAQCAKQLSPCSTFKIPNSLIGLETGVIPDADFVIPWDGAVYPVESWNRDHSLESAIQNSVVWYYRELAARVGNERMQQYVSAIPYGNADISGGATFWLASSLEISADEQVEFLRRFDANDLPFSQRALDIVKEIITLEQAGDYVYRGKTGSCMAGDGREWGWFVGYVTAGKQVSIFAVNIEGARADGRQACEIAETILKHLNLLPAHNPNP